MITLEPDLPDHLVIAHASDTVTADDYDDVLIPAVEAAIADGSKARVLFVLGADFTGYDRAAMQEDRRFGMHHWGDFERIALVTDRESWRVAVRAVGFLMPGEARVFALDDVDQARAWITG